MKEQTKRKIKKVIPFIIGGIGVVAAGATGFALYKSRKNVLAPAKGLADCKMVFSDESGRAFDLGVDKTGYYLCERLVVKKPEFFDHMKNAYKTLIDELKKDEVLVIDTYTCYATDNFNGGSK